MKDVTECVDCGIEMEPLGMEEEMPLRGIEMECPDCGLKVVFGQVFYPDERFTVIGPAPPGEECHRCEQDAVLRTQQVGHPVKMFCDDHCPGHFTKTYEWARDNV